MANHYLLVGVASRDFHAQGTVPERDREWYFGDEFVGALIPSEVKEMEYATGYFDVLSVRVDEAEGDQSPKLIQIECRWKAPTPDVLAKITSWLCNKFFLKQIAWVGHDPADCSVHHLEAEAHDNP